MLYVEENPKEAKTFTDETSPRKPPASDRKVSIHGQVIRDLPLNWFYDLRGLYPGDSWEVKSTRILNDFHNLPADKKNKIWAGMKRVIINIFDSLSYQIDYKKILNDVYKNDRAYELVKQHASQGNEFARSVLARMDEAVTKRIIRDSAPHRLRDMMRPRQWPGSLAFNIYQPQRVVEEVDLTPFKTKKSSMAGKAVKYAAKSGSVFNRAMDIARPRAMLWPDSWTHFYMCQALRDSHAFDRGDDKSLGWIDGQRREVMRGGPFGHCDYYFYEDESLGRLYSIPSDSSGYTQAADIAAGFARQDYERHGIAAVAGKFDYLTLNGERITQNNAEEKFELWRQLTEQERLKNQGVVTLN